MRNPTTSAKALEILSSSTAAADLKALAAELGVGLLDAICKVEEAAYEETMGAVNKARMAASKASVDFGKKSSEYAAAKAIMAQAEKAHSDRYQVVSPKARALRRSIGY